MSQKKKRQPKPISIYYHGTVQFSGFYKVKVWGASLLWGLLSAAFIADAEMQTVWMLLAFVPFWILSILCILHLSIAVTYDDDGFVYRNLFCKSRSIEWAQITQIREEQGYHGSLHRSHPKPFQDIIITAGGKRIRLDGDMEHIFEFRMLLQMKCADKFDSPQEDS